VHGLLPVVVIIGSTPQSADIMPQSSSCKDARAKLSKPWLLGKPFCRDLAVLVGTFDVSLAGTKMCRKNFNPKT
jgi:hypothetical protein